MTNLIMFSSERELSKLTGLDHDGLWKAGFDLDDWDVGFMSEEPLTRRVYYDDGGEITSYFEPLRGSDWLIDRMDNYACGYKHTEYNGKHYYMVYHS